MLEHGLIFSGCRKRHWTRNYVTKVAGRTWLFVVLNETKLKKMGTKNCARGVKRTLLGEFLYTVIMNTGQGCPPQIYFSPVT